MTQKVNSSFQLKGNFHIDADNIHMSVLGFVKQEKN